MTDEAALLLAQYTAASTALDTQTGAAVFAPFVGLTVHDWYTPSATIAASTAAAARVTAGLDAGSGLTQQWARMLLDWLGVKPKDRRGAQFGYPRNADILDVYARPVFAYRDAVALGASFDEALRQVEARVNELVATDLALAARKVEQFEYKAAGIKKYRRVIRPELAKSGLSCGLCITASQQIYTIKQLSPIHTSCHCRTMAITDDKDPGLRLNEADLSRIANESGGNKAADLKRTRYRITDVGELEAVLVPKRRTAEQRRSRRDQARHIREGWSDPDRIRTELARLEPVLKSLEARAANGENVAGPLDYQHSRIANLRAQLEKQAR